MKLLFSTLAISAIALTSVKAADIINFEDISPTPGNGVAIPDGFGSTAQVAVSYRTLLTDFSLSSSHINFWGTGYADLPAAGWSAGQGLIGEVTLTPISGFQVTLNGFDMGAFFTAPSGTQTEDLVRIVHDSTSLDLGPAEISHTTANHFSPNVTSTGPISIQFGHNFNNGIDHIAFTAAEIEQVPTVPDQGATLLLLGSALTALALARRSFPR